MASLAFITNSEAPAGCGWCVARVWRYLLSELCFSRQLRGYTRSSLLDEFLWHCCAALLYHAYPINAQSYLIFHPGCGDLYEEAVRSPRFIRELPALY